MITRAQAEALLTLAEALEACERICADVTVNWVENGLYYGAQESGAFLDAMELRLAISAAVPKSIGS